MTIRLQATDALLTYTPTTDPDPLTASTDKDITVAKLELTVGRNMTQPAYCRKITVKIPIGPNSNELTNTYSGIKPGVIGGTEPEHGGGWDALTPTTEDGKRVFTFKPDEWPQFDGSWVITLVISQIEINTVTGRVPIEIIEETSPTDSNYTPKSAVVTVEKFPAGFLFRNLRPSKIMVDNGETVKLTWEVQNATCRVFWDKLSEQVDDREWESGPLYNTTGFMVQATSTTDATMVHTLTTAVTVWRPDLEVGELIVHGTITARGDVEIDPGGTLRTNTIDPSSGHRIALGSTTTVKGWLETDDLILRGRYLRFCVLEQGSTTWSAPELIPIPISPPKVPITDLTLAAGAFGDRILCIYADGDERNEMLFDGVSWVAGWNDRYSEYRYSSCAPGVDIRGAGRPVYMDRGGHMDGLPDGIKRAWSSSQSLTKMEEFVLFVSPEGIVNRAEYRRTTDSYVLSQDSPVQLPWGALSGVGLARFNNALTCLFIGAENAVHCSRDWLNPSPLNNWRSRFRPALAAFDGKLHALITTMNGALVWSSTSTENWPEAVEISDPSSVPRAPVLTVYQNKLYAIF
ncbi:hypothetical protein [Kitasatospora sp. NPDC056273]|uniref:hypothetical protein n=1 Tax=Kitasatospora sp. NPDC056273 TaxID=3345769 RepID=UPI0035DE21C2